MNNSQPIFHLDIPIDNYISKDGSEENHSGASNETLTVEQYIFHHKELKDKVKLHREVLSITEKQLRDLKANYIKQNQPYPIGTRVHLIRQNKTGVIGEIKKYSIYQETEIYISEIKVGTKLIGIDKPAMEVHTID